MGIISERRQRVAAFLRRWSDHLASEALTDEQTPPEVERFSRELQAFMADLAAADAADGAEIERRNRARGN